MYRACEMCALVCVVSPAAGAPFLCFLITEHGGFTPLATRATDTRATRHATTLDGARGGRRRELAHTGTGLFNCTRTHCTGAPPCPWIDPRGVHVREEVWAQRQHSISLVFGTIHIESHRSTRRALQVDIHRRNVHELTHEQLHHQVAVVRVGPPLILRVVFVVQRPCDRREEKQLAVGLRL